MSTHPKWYRILRYWRDKKDGQGLSFSFLVGATRTPMAMPFAGEVEAREYSSELYDEITTALVDGCVVNIRYCGDKVDGFVVTLESGVPRGFYRHHMPAFDELWQFYGKAITDGQFSLTRNRFHTMTAEEMKWIAKALEECASAGE